MQSHRPRAMLASFALLLAGFQPASGTAEQPVSIEVLSNRADLISDGNALVAIDAPSFDGIVVTLNGDDITSAFAMRPNGRFQGLVTGLALDEDGVTPNTLSAELPGGSGATIIITNHPNSGPIFSGPLITPWRCQASAENPTTCDQAPIYSYVYSPAGPGAVGTNVAGFSVGGGFQPYDPENPPPAETIAFTTTDNGETVPYIVRIETGYQLRDQYKIAVLWQPGRPWEPWAAQPQWNHKLLITHGASCGIDHQSGSAPDVLNHPALSRGFAVMSTALNNAGHNCNIATEAESMIMAKERLIENYGEVRYTIGTGCSGGSLVQYQVANAYPGLYDGILPQCSFADAWSTGIQLEDSSLLRTYFEDPTRWGPGIAWDPASIGAVEGHPNHVNAVLLSTYTSLFQPTTACAGVPEGQRYHPQTNPSGHRCTGQDYMVNQFGKRPSDGFANRPLDNVGVQYGLQALMRGAITPAQFVDLNTRIGSHDIDYVWQRERGEADPGALDVLYSKGIVNTATHLDEVAIIDLRGTDPGAFHDVFRAFAVRARLEREHNGSHANQVIWMAPIPLLGELDFPTRGFIAMDRWLAAVEADDRDVPKAEKIVEDRPADIHDECTDGAGHPIPDERTCHTINPIFTTPRMVAGGPFTDDVHKCQLRPQRRSDYLPVEFTTAEWSALTAAFPDGVCDYSKPGVGHAPSTPWITYQDGTGEVIYGGVPVGPPPRSTPFS